MISSACRALALFACLPLAQAGEHEVCAQGTACRAASPAELDGLRGGFELDTPGGRLHLSLGIRRAVSVNDRVVAVGELALPGAILVQNGPGNAAPALSALATGALPILVQNTLDNQKLGTVTIVDASVNSLSVMNVLRAGEMLNRATAASGR